MAKDSDLKAAFGTTDQDKVILEILEKGEVQVGSEERGQHLQMLTRKVATIISEKTINPRTRTPYPLGIIEQALAEVHFSPNPTKTAKQQALEMIRILERDSKLPIARAQMRLLIESSSTDSDQLMKAIALMISSIEDSVSEPMFKITCVVDPNQYRLIVDAVAKVTKGRGAVHVLAMRDSGPNNNETPSSIERKNV